MSNTKTLQISILLLTLFFWGGAKGQIVYNKLSHDLGELNTGDPLFFDFKISNASKAPIYILRIEEPYGIKTKYSNKLITPDSSVIIRMKYTPKRKGKFNAKIPVWFSSNNEPIAFSLKGNVKTFDPNEGPDCPDFSKSRKKPNDQFPLNVKVVDAQTGSPINNALVEIVWDGLIYKKKKTNNNGEISQQLKRDIYYFIASADEYLPAEKDYYVNVDNTSLTISLNPKDKNVDPALVIEEEETIVPVEEEIVVTLPTTLDTTNTTPTQNTQLNTNLYKANNIVFLIDVSLSMKQEGRMDLLKSSMIELARNLRPIDKIAIVTYASETTIALASTPVTNQKVIIQTIQELKAGGYTAGHKGIKKAYQVAKHNYIAGANNQIILATDGAFNLDSRDKSIIKTVERQADEIQISVVGIKNEKWTAKSMAAIAKSGKGNYISIKSFKKSKDVLLEEIKKQSKK